MYLSQTSLSIFKIILLLPLTTAQFAAYPFFPPNAVAVSEIPSNCKQSYTHANASGTYSLPSSFVNGEWNGGRSDEYLSWTVTVGQNTSTSEFTSSNYLGTPPGIDFSSGDNGYSACGLFLGGLSENLIRRGQNDEGDCTGMFDVECVKAIRSQLETIALGFVATWTDNSPAPSNLSAGSLGRVCGNIKDAFVAKGAVPSECAKFVGEEGSWYDRVDSNVTFTTTSLTGPNSTTSETCTFNTTTLPNTNPYPSNPASNLSLITQSSSSFNTTNQTRINNIYDEAVTNIYPIFTILFPAANDSNRGSGTVDTAEAFLTCARPVNITAGSRIAPALPAATALRKISHPLSAGAKAGIAVGVIVGVLLLAGLVACGLSSRRRKRRDMENELALGGLESKMRDQKEEARESKTPMLGGEERVEVEGDAGGGERGMLDGRQVYEAPGLVGTEMEGERWVAELEGSGVQHGGGRY